MGAVPLTGMGPDVVMGGAYGLEGVPGAMEPMRGEWPPAALYAGAG